MNSIGIKADFKHFWSLLFAPCGEACCLCPAIDIREEVVVAEGTGLHLIVAPCVGDSHVNYGVKVWGRFVAFGVPANDQARNLLANVGVRNPDWLWPNVDVYVGASILVPVKYLRQ